VKEGLVTEDRIRDDDSLLPPDGRPPSFIKNPAMIVHKQDDGKLGFVVAVPVLDEAMDDPRYFGVALSDLLDHVASAYSAVTGRDQRDVRRQLFKTMQDEERFKEKDPKRGSGIGATIWPKEGRN
jgi:hypothetical protein